MAKGLEIMNAVAKEMSRNPIRKPKMSPKELAAMKEKDGAPEPDADDELPVAKSKKPNPFQKKGV